MAEKRIIAHFMHETECAAAEQEMNEYETTGSFVIGKVNEAKIPRLREEGLIIEVLDDDVREMPVGFNRDRHQPLGVWRESDESMTEVDLDRPNFYLVQISGPLLEPWRQSLKAIGIDSLESIAPRILKLRLELDQLQPVRDLHFVDHVRLFRTMDEHTLEIESLDTGASPQVDYTRMLTFDVRLHRPEDLDAFKDWLTSENVAIAGARGQKVRLYLPENSPMNRRIVDRTEVRSMEEFIPPELHNDRARVLVGVDTPAQPPALNIAQTGRGVVVGIADTGVDDTHPDLKNRISAAVALGRPGDSSDPDGHGTHVAGTVVGDGTASGGQIRGLAPEAKIFFQSIMDSQGNLGGLPLDLNTMFDDAYSNGARIHNNSWGSATNSRYRFSSMEVDEFVDDHRDMLIVISAGNEGTAKSPKNSATGYVDWLSIGAPASSKNGLTVGASRSDRTSGGYSTMDYGTVWPGDYPDPPISSEMVSGDQEAMAAFSSRGPCDDRRIKPDLVAPGTDIASAKSSKAPASGYWGPVPGHGGNYAYMGGTSMAAPVVSGCAAIIRQYYAEVRQHEPSAALLKATLVNSTRWLSAIDSVAEFADSPNFHQGFGCVYLPWAIPNNAENDLRLEFVDSWQNPAEQFTNTGNRLQYLIDANGHRELRFCLTWTDVPGRALQNNLNLTVQHVTTKKKYLGNADLPLSLNIPDPDNNIEIIRIPNPDPGQYLIQVSAYNLLSDSQDFALVVTGDLPANINII